MTDEQIIERLATEVMGWTTEYVTELVDKMSVDEGVTLYLNDMWTPLTDWNHWRQVEERISGMLLIKYIRTLSLKEYAADVIIADLPTRCKAILAALDSLSPS